MQLAAQFPIQGHAMMYAMHVERLKYTIGKKVISIYASVRVLHCISSNLSLDCTIVIHVGLFQILMRDIISILLSSTFTQLPLSFEQGTRVESTLMHANSAISTTIYASCIISTGRALLSLHGNRIAITLKNTV